MSVLYFIAFPFFCVCNISLHFLVGNLFALKNLHSFFIKIIPLLSNWYAWDPEGKRAAWGGEDWGGGALPSPRPVLGMFKVEPGLFYPSTMLSHLIYYYIKIRIRHVQLCRHTTILVKEENNVDAFYSFSPKLCICFLLHSAIFNKRFRSWAVLPMIYCITVIGFFSPKTILTKTVDKLIRLLNFIYFLLVSDSIILSQETRLVAFMYCFRQ
jgi:hypothetical protein